MSENHVNGYDYDEEEEPDLQAELDEGFAEIEQRFAVDTQEGFENVVVVDNVPIVDESKKQRLIERLRSVFEKAGAPIDEDRFNMPWDEKSGQNKGFIFLTYPDALQADNALRVLNNLPFGKQHTLYVNRFGDIEKYANMPIGEGELPTGWREKPFVERDHLRSWLADPQGRDQYVTFRDTEVNLLWNGRNGNAEPVKDQETGKPIKNPKWGEFFLQWSPLGTYLASLHRVGVALWCGPRLDGPIGVNVFRFTHPGVRAVAFSPCENYLVTWSPEPFENVENSPNASIRATFTAEDEGNQIVVWDIKSVRVLRTFPEDKRTTPDGQPVPPVLKWSPDDAYVARIQQGSAIQVYELPGMGLLDKKSVKIEGVQDFEWCPMSQEDHAARKAGKGKECMLAYWTPEAENKPARVNVMAIPSRNNLRAKNLFNVTDCKFYWHNEGRYLCVKVDRHRGRGKSKDKASYCNLEIFRVREQNIPVEVIEHKEYIPSFTWEPYGNRFAIVSTSDPAYGQHIPGVIPKFNVSLFQLDPKKGDFACVKVIPDKAGNFLTWSPKGRHLIIATLGSSTKYDIEFWDTDFTTDDNPRAKEKEGAEAGANVTLLATGEHYGITDAPQWDPSGRYLATVASVWRPTAEPGYTLWDFKGTQLQHVPAEKFKQLLWRPRPPTLLGKDDLKKVRRELKEHSRQFDEEDAAEENRGSAEKLAARQRDVAEWNAWRARNVARLLEARKARGKELSRPALEAKAEEEEKVEEWVEEMIDETEEVVVA